MRKYLGTATKGGKMNLIDCFDEFIWSADGSFDVSLQMEPTHIFIALLIYFYSSGVRPHGSLLDLCDWNNLCYLGPSFLLRSNPFGNVLGGVETSSQMSLIAQPTFSYVG